MMYGTYLDREVHTTEDLLDVVQKGIGSNARTTQTTSKDKGNGRASKTTTKTTFSIEPATKQETLLQQ